MAVSTMHGEGSTVADPPGRGPLLVTGLPRSGTSWAGKMLEASRQVVYVNEPLNPRHPPGHSPGVLRADVTHQFQYICAANDGVWAAAFGDTTALRYHPLAELRRNHTGYDLARMAKYLAAFTGGRLRGRRALLDDPYAVLSTLWFVRRLGCRALVLVRDPVAVIGSWQRLGWTVDLRQLLDQPLLVRRLPERLVTEMRHLSAAADPDGPATTNGGDSDPARGRIARTALLWRVVYTLVHELRGQQGVSVRRYEDLVAKPLPGFREVYEATGLDWSDRAAQAVTAATGAKEGEEEGKEAACSSDDGRAHTWSLRGGLSRTAYRPMSQESALGSYRQRLTQEDIDRVRALTADVGPLFYPENYGPRPHARSRTR